MKFVCVGIDARLLPCRGFYSADSAEWERDDTWYSRLLASEKAMQNEYGFLFVRDQKALDDICDKIISSSKACDLVAISLPLEIVQFFDTRWGFQTSSNTLNLSRFICRGFDVCDFNGFITLFNHPLIAKYCDEAGLIPEWEISKALEAVQLANFVEADHRPFVIAKVYSLRMSDK